MSDCCDTDCTKKYSPRRFTCPVNKNEYIEVPIKTILQQIQSPWKSSWESRLTNQNYYFCDDPECDVVYFGLDGSVIKKSDLRIKVGVKEKTEDAQICYCFGVSKAEALQNPEIKRYVTQQTKEKNCACDIRNPSGRCCLKDFPKKH